MESKIKISSSKDSEFYSKFQLDNETYEVGTEDLGKKKTRIVTRIYRKGEILSTTTKDYADLDKLTDNSEKIRTMMEEQHKSAVEVFIREQTRLNKSKADCAEEIRLALKDNNKKAAMDAAREALQNFPSDPVFLSYFGYLTAIVEGKPRDGVKKCEEAIKVLRVSKSADMLFFLPLFYLNLGRAQLKAGKRKASMNAFQEGLKYDPHNAELNSEIKAFGTRKAPVVPFLNRDNPINKYLGKIRHDLQNKKK